MPSNPDPLAALRLLLCPVCAAEMLPNGPRPADGIRCAEGHRFDGARQGYINLLTGRGTSFTPDTAAMVAAREAFLSAGGYAPLAGRVAAEAAQLLAGRTSPAVLDAGAGTGYYLAHVLAGCPDAAAVALDISKFALRRATRAVPGALCLVWDLWRPLPLAAASVDLVLNVFAPRNAAEYARVLAPGGHLLVVTPAPGHLAQLRDVLPLLAIGEDKAAKLAETLSGHFVETAATEVSAPLELDADGVEQLVLMGPNAHHTDATAIRAALAGTALPLAVEARFTLSVFRRQDPVR
ncbi:methyltransferase domain-containing protein [Arthrobacter sp. I2-34]|uniref:Methyltransferase domain-containing protein n=1 Tax=Arthrobacter hankyongi TaxID=2904801 RepID=A0ABS9L653_9MICC|nr:methyltransferase domain-containing protein [Arthrobacter hankyongi]MCG2622157.1 methyltransferase domain-containing protein [Arthrobacter hankyongi]